MSDEIRYYDNSAYKKDLDETVINVPVPANGADTITYSWHNVNVFATEEKRCCDRRSKNKTQVKKHILKDVTGICRPGELLALMGASGAGKTTLLNVLTGRSSSKLEITGDLNVNGGSITPSQLTSRSAYIQQEDLFVGTLTVREMLTFQAMLRMDRDIPKARRLQRVEEVIVELGLLKCQNTLIGIPGKIKGISGGETKRLAFACEVLTDPPLMFCDEPTTGLDSFMAQTIVQTMKNLAMKNKTIITTIHQPSSEVFALFDRVLLIAEGRVAFLGLSSDALSFFKSEGMTCPRNFNPADFFISNLAVQPDKEDECRAKIGNICDHFRDNSLGITVMQSVQQNMNGHSEENRVLFADKKQQTYKSGWLEQMKAVTKRSMTEVIREPTVLRVKFFQTLMTSLLLGLIFLGQENTQDGISNLNGAIFLLLTNLSFSNVFGVVNVFCMQLPIFLREHANGMYSSSVYFVAKNIAEVPLAVVLPAIFVAIVYYMIGFNPDVERFFIAMAILVLVANIAVSFGYFVSCIANSLDMALAISAPLLIPLMLFGGFFINSDSVPWYFVWLKYLSWFNYGNEALIINQWKGVENITCPDEYPQQLCSTNGEQVITKLGYDVDNLGFDIGLLVVLFVGFRALGMILLGVKAYRKP